MPFTTMSNDDNDESEYAMCKHHVNCPTTLKPPKPNMLHFWHKEQGREQGKTLLPNTWVM